MLRTRLIPLGLAAVLALGVGGLGTAFAAQSNPATGTTLAQAGQVSSGSEASDQSVAKPAPKKHASANKSTSKKHARKKSSKSTHAAKQPAQSSGQKM